MLLKSKGPFYEMCKKTGPAMFKHLVQMARKAYNLHSSSGKGVGSLVLEQQLEEEDDEEAGDDSDDGGDGEEGDNNLI